MGKNKNNSIGQCIGNGMC